MNQKFTKIENDKVKWEYTREESEYQDQELGKLGVQGGYSYIIFDNKEQAMAVLDKDVVNSEANIDKYKQDMTKNEHSLDKFTQIKELVEAVGKLHNDFKEIKNIPEKLYADNPKKYQKLLREFNNAKDYIKEEMSELNKEYGRYIAYKPAKQSYDFNIEQLEKIKEQQEQLNKL